MLQFVDNYFLHIDDRGSIVGLINHGSWKELNIITSEAEVVRGNHYHMKTHEIFIILEGHIEVHTQDVNNGKLIGDLTVCSVKTGDVIWVEPFTNHIFIPKCFSKWINVLSEPVDKEQPDFHRVRSNND